ncbi:hypothetical protein HNO88_004215 [Novosphingobium chloroacetimidivorans]|uniref:Uncharacterized protein n=1 Tax=Novosphingobium chloroacetimidivorans TaxID=1428314 RepID=A0A7W7NYT1_9SPHN|nr:hypothetical protein [Novosphingobium chloroacetimidivorans]
MTTRAEMIKTVINKARGPKLIFTVRKVTET